jgi:hypothetical protein
VTHGESNLKAQRRYPRPVDRRTGLICDQIMSRQASTRARRSRSPLRRIRFIDPKTSKRLDVPDERLALAGPDDQRTVSLPLVVELLFKWIKQHLRIKKFYGTTEDAVKTQIWIAVSTCVLVTIVKKRLKVHASLYEMLQILSLTMFEQTPFDTLFSQIRAAQNDADATKQLNLFR